MKNEKKVRSDYNWGIIFLCFELFFFYVGLGGISMSAIAVLIPLFARAILHEEQYNNHLVSIVAAQFGGVVIGNPLVNFIY